MSRTTLEAEGENFAFEDASVVFHPERTTNVFAKKINCTVFETTGTKRYSSLSAEIGRSYLEYVNYPIGPFLLIQKDKGNPFYKEFLNPNGDLVYCKFRLSDTRYSSLKGIYIFSVGNQLQYIGQTRDSFGKRINFGYGNISPKNCYKDGQSTNCYINSQISSRANNIKLAFCPLPSSSNLKQIEDALVLKYSPPWNYAIRRGKGAIER